MFPLLAGSLADAIAPALAPALAPLAAVPFLPHGKGALILILGGLAVLPASLLWSRASTGTQRWVAGLEQGGSHLGLGPYKVVSAGLRSCIVILRSCPSCRGLSGKGAPCRREQRALVAAVESRAPGASAVEVSCNTGGRGSCTFVVHRGRSP